MDGCPISLVVVFDNEKEVGKGHTSVIKQDCTNKGTHPSTFVTFVIQQRQEVVMIVMIVVIVMVVVIV